MNRKDGNVRDQFVKRLDKLANKETIWAPDEQVIIVERESATDAFRWLRNNSPLLNDADKHDLLKSRPIVDTCLLFCKSYFLNKPLSQCVVLQFLANFSMKHEAASRYIFTGFREVLKGFIVSSNNPRLLNNSIMLLYNLCLSNTDFRLDILNDAEIVQKCMTHWSENEVEYSKIFLDSIFSSSEDFVIVYSNLPDVSKAQMLDLISTWLEYYEDDVAVKVIITIRDNYFMDSVVEDISKNVVSVLAKASSTDRFGSAINKHTLMLKKLMDILKDIHERSKNSNNLNDEFSRVKDLSALFGDSDVQTHTRFWFKSDLIRLIASMCYNNKEHQNLMRSNNIIPILLECCSFDAKNPLMREWSVFALRNIMEGNFDNQNFVANIDSVGSVNPEASVTFTDTLGVASTDSDTMFI